MIPYGKQLISEDDIQAVVEVLQSDWLTQGPTVERFESTVAAYCGVKYAVAVSNATAALHLACLSLGLSPGDWLWTSPNTFVASANCARYCGADVDFVDIDARSYNLSMVELRRKLEVAQRNNRLPKVVVPVHFAGQSCEMEPLRELADHYGFAVLEDASHAIGGSYRAQKIGACTFSDMAVFSFHPVKIVTTGEGGMILTHRPDLYQALIELRSHGITRSPARMGEPSPAPWYYEQIELGFNYRLTDMQAALGNSQMHKIDTFIERRRQIFARYNAQLQGLPVTLPWQHPDTDSALHLYVIRLHRAALQRSQREIFEALRAQGIGVQIHYIPVHLQPYYQKLGFQAGDFPEAEAYYQEALSLPIFPALTEQQQDVVIRALREVLS